MGSSALRRFGTSGPRRVAGGGLEVLWVPGLSVGARHRPSASPSDEREPHAGMRTRVPAWLRRCRQVLSGLASSPWAWWRAGRAPLPRPLPRRTRPGASRADYGSAIRPIGAPFTVAHEFHPGGGSRPARAPRRRGISPTDSLCREHANTAALEGRAPRQALKQAPRQTPRRASGPASRRGKRGRPQTLWRESQAASAALAVLDASHQQAACIALRSGEAERDEQIGHGWDVREIDFGRRS